MKYNIENLMKNNLSKKATFGPPAEVAFARGIVKNHINTYSINEKRYLSFSYVRSTSSSRGLSHFIEFKNNSEFTDDRYLEERSSVATNFVQAVPKEEYYRTIEPKFRRNREINLKGDRVKKALMEIKFEVVRKQFTLTPDSFMMTFEFSEDYNNLSVYLDFSYKKSDISNDYSNENLKLPYQNESREVTVVDLRVDELSRKIFNTSKPPNKFLRVVVRNEDEEIIESTIVKYDSRELKKYIYNPEYKDTETEVIFPEKNKRSSKIRNKSKATKVKKEVKKIKYDSIDEIAMYAIGDYVFEAFKKSYFIFKIEIRAFNNKTNLHFCKTLTEESENYLHEGRIKKHLGQGNYRSQNPKDLSNNFIKGIIQNYNNSGMDAYLDLDNISFDLNCGIIPIKAILK